MREGAARRQATSPHAAEVGSVPPRSDRRGGAVKPPARKDGRARSRRTPHSAPHHTQQPAGGRARGARRDGGDTHAASAVAPNATPPCPADANGAVRGGEGGTPIGTLKTKEKPPP